MNLADLLADTARRLPDKPAFVLGQRVTTYAQLEAATQKTAKVLKQAGILRVRGEINPEVLERQQLAVIAINVNESRLLDQKAVEVNALENVQHVMVVSGQFDLLAEVLVDSNKGLVEFLTEKLSTISGITATQSFIVLKSLGLYV